MKRRAVLGLLLLLPLGAWLVGRAPSRFVLEEACSAWQQERRGRDLDFLQRIAEAERQGLAEIAEGAKRDRDAALREHGRTEIRGWEIAFLAPGSDRPRAEGFLVAGSFDPSRPTDSPLLRGAHEIWVRPRAPLPRLLRALRVSP